MNKLRVVILISGSGTNLQAIIDAAHQGLAVDICGVISDQSSAYGLHRAEQAGIPTSVILRNHFMSKMTFEHHLAETIDAYAPELIVLAGFMRILSDNFVNRFVGRMINIHPSLLPKYPGLHTHERVLAAKEREHGASVHFVTAEVDGGPIICQSKLTVYAHDTAATLNQRIQSLEHNMYPKVLSWFAEKKISLNPKEQLIFNNKPLHQPILL